MTFRRTLVRLVPVTLVAVAAMALYLPERNPVASVSPESTLDRPGTAALRAAIDPETGQLVTGPSATHLAAEADKGMDAELARMLSRSDAGLIAVHHPDGHVSVNLEGRFMSASVARLGEEGQVETLCTENQAEAAEFLKQKPHSASSEWEVR